MLGRDTEWRQGDLLTDEQAHAIRLVDSLNSDRCIVLISHDCDLPNDAEIFVEVIAGSLVQALDPMLTNARNPRRLHLKFASDAEEGVCVELRHVDRQQVSKSVFAKIGTRNGNVLLPIDEKRALKQWLAARYGRPAFPNAFENRLRKTVGKKSVEYHIAKILVPASSYLVAIFFDLGEDKARELKDQDPYFLSILVVYDAVDGGPNARLSAEKVANELRTLFEHAYGKVDSAIEIALEACNAVADTFMTLADLRRVDQWRVDYISLREDPAGYFLPAGELPA